MLCTSNTSNAIEIRNGIMFDFYLRLPHNIIYICTNNSMYMHTCTVIHTHQVKEVYVKENDSIGEDEVILEFYPEEQD